MTGADLKRWRRLTGYTQAQAARAALISKHRLCLAEIDELRLNETEMSALKATYIDAIRQGVRSVLVELHQPEIVVGTLPAENNFGCAKPTLRQLGSAEHR